MNQQIFTFSLYIFLKYTVIAGIPFLVFYHLIKGRFSSRKIQQDFPTNKDYRREIGYSILSSAILAATGIIALASPITKFTQVYHNVSEHSLGYGIISLVLMVMIHDTYFYWMHRAIHHPAIFKRVHLIHHKSTNPSPWAAQSWHPLEAILEAGVIWLFVFLFPVHPLLVSLYLLFSLAHNVNGHLGYFIIPEGKVDHWMFSWLNGSARHNAHHHYFKGNYGLYFTFWDRLMGTQRTC
ncbi:sterol desaturase family protein [Mucilaginibacter sp.]|jgi:sterol desaturase/sphingolipid hydroxylase (fatty acid hydroxylase superfamily)|uniref:sterol desaturase family protein n=1 Tax=Mucilaginibacter sp. TaxID=1882438 RepID=UPI00356817CE